MKCVKTIIAAASFVASLMSASAAFAQNSVAGAWELTIDSPQGANTSTLTLKQDGEKLTGTYAGQFGQSQLKGTVKGNNADWTFENDQVGTISYSGTIDGTKMKGKVQYGAVGSGTFTAEKSK